MARGGRGITVEVGEIKPNQAEIDALVHGPSGRVGRLMVYLAERVTQVGKKKAPVGSRSSKRGHPSGYLRSQIGWLIGRDGGDIVVDIWSPAKTSAFNPRPGEPYGYWTMRPAERPYPLPEDMRKGHGPYLEDAAREVLHDVLGGGA